MDKHFPTRAALAVAALLLTVQAGATRFKSLQAIDKETLLVQFQDGDARVILEKCYPDWNTGGWPRQESFFNQRYFWVNGEFTPRETMRGKMALLGYLYGIRP